MLLALLGVALALPPAVLGPEGPMWVGPLRPTASASGTVGAGPFVVVDPGTGALWVEERLSSGSRRTWERGAWYLDGEAMTAAREVSGHRWEETRLVSAPGAHGARVTFRYDKKGRLVGIGWPNGAALKVGYSDAGRVASLSGPGPGLWRLNWEKGLSVRDPLGRSLTVQTEEGDGRRTVTVRDALGRTVRSRYEAIPGGEWRLAGWQDPRGLHARISHGDGKLEVKDAAGRAWRVRLDDKKRVVQVTQPAGQRWVWHRDDLGRVKRQDDPAGRITRWERDDAGRVVGVVRGGHHTRYRRDDAGRVVAVVASSGGTTELVRDERGRITSIRDAAGNPVFFERHDNGWPSSILGRTGGKWEVGLDLLGRPSLFVDPSGQERKLKRDAVGQLNQLEHPVYGKIKLVYSQDGHLTRVVDAKERALSLSWDGGGRLVGVDAPGQVLKIRRDPAGDVVAIGRGEEEVIIQRDPTGLPLRAGNVQWIRDLSGRVSGMRRPGLDLRLDRDPAGLLRGLRAGTWELDIHRDGVGWPVGWTGTDGTLDITRDGSGRITREAGERTLRVRRGGRGQVDRVLGDVGEWRWLRDGAGRVLRVHGGEHANVGFNRDDSGRVSLVRLPGGALVRRKHLPDGVAEVVVDSGGSMIDARTVRWDLDGRLGSVTNQAGQGWVWRRDAAGRVLGVDVNDGGGSWSFTDKSVTGPAGEFMLVDGEGRISEVQLPETVGIWGQKTARVGIHRTEHGPIQDLTGDEGQTSVQHDTLGRLKSVRLPDGRAWTLRYDVRGRPGTVVDPAGGEHELVWQPAVERPTGLDLLAVVGPKGTVRMVRGPGGSGIVIGKESVELVMTAEREPAWRFVGRGAPESLSASPQGLGSGAYPRWIGPGGLIPFFPGGPLLSGIRAIEPVSGGRTDGARRWKWAVAKVRADGTEDRWDPGVWDPESPWARPLQLLRAMGELAAVDEGSWWMPPAGPVGVSWLPRSLDGAAPPLGRAPQALPLSEMDPITSAWLAQVLTGEGEVDLDLPAREVLRAELKLPWLPPGLSVPGLGSWGLTTASSKP